MYQSVELLIPIAGMAMVFGIVYIAVRAENRKKMAMIEAGMNPDEKVPSTKNANLKRALLFIFIPIGFILGKKLDIIMGNFFFSGLLGAFIFGGLALLLFYFIEQRQENKD